jgi:DNA-binding CsgD family transcriptional regulator/tetratricopeptide (TPR) repeat protein
MVGRDGEIAAAAAAFDVVRAGSSALIVIRGEAGIGKTRLLGELAELAATRHLDIATGRATELEADVPLAVFRQALAELALPGDLDHESRWRLFDSVAAIVTARQRLALVVDDVHWADPASLELLDTLVRRPPASPHALVVSSRPGRAADAVLAAARAAGRTVTLLELTPLDRAAADALVGASRSEQDRGRLYELSGGNPLLLEELAKAGPTSQVPPSIVAAMSAELRPLHGPARALIEAGALLGDPFDIDLAGQIASLAPDVGLAAADELVERALLRPTTSLREFAFRHPVLRTALYEGLPVSRRLHGHARAAAVLRELGSPLPGQAHHLVHTAAPGDVGAAQLLRAAAAMLRSQAPSIAADWLLAAKRAAPPADLTTFSELAEVLVQSGRLEEALAAAEEGLSFGRGTDEARLRLTLAAGSVERLMGRHDAARRRLLRALDTSPTAATRAGLMAALVLSAYERGEYDEMATWAARARNETSAPALVRGVGAATLAMGNRFAGDPAASDLEADFAVAVVRDASDDELAEQAELLTAISWALVAVERLDDALIVSRRSARAAQRAGNAAAAVPHLLAEVSTLGLLGRTREAVVVADRTELLARLTHNDQTIQWALWMRAWVLLDEGELDAALACAKQSVALAERLEESALRTVSNAVLGSVLLATGETERARTLLAAYDVEPGWICRWAPRLVSAELALGQIDAAQAVARRASGLARSVGLAGAAAAADRAESMVAAARGDRSAAATWALSALRRSESIGADLDSAQAHILAGVAIAEEDQPAAAKHFTAAHELAERGGAHRTSDEAARELRRIGRRVGRGGTRGARSAGLDTLSIREREIADLVASGMTNRQIAARLFLSEKTIESHLSKTFTKLGIASRAALAAAVAAR